MRKIKNGFNLKIVSLVAAVLFFLNGAVYGMDLFLKTHLRKPILFNEAISGDEGKARIDVIIHFKNLLRDTYGNLLQEYPELKDVPEWSELWDELLGLDDEMILVLMKNPLVYYTLTRLSWKLENKLSRSFIESERPVLKSHVDESLFLPRIQANHEIKTSLDVRVGWGGSIIFGKHPVCMVLDEDYVDKKLQVQTEGGNLYVYDGGVLLFQLPVGVFLRDSPGDYLSIEPAQEGLTVGLWSYQGIPGAESIRIASLSLIDLQPLAEAIALIKEVWPEGYERLLKYTHQVRYEPQYEGTAETVVYLHPGITRLDTGGFDKVELAADLLHANEHSWVGVTFPQHYRGRPIMEEIEEFSGSPWDCTSIMDLLDEANAHTIGLEFLVKVLASRYQDLPHRKAHLNVATMTKAEITEAVTFIKEKEFGPLTSSKVLFSNEQIRLLEDIEVKLNDLEERLEELKAKGPLEDVAGRISYQSDKEDGFLPVPDLITDFGTFLRRVYWEFMRYDWSRFSIETFLASYTQREDERREREREVVGGLHTLFEKFSFFEKAAKKRDALPPEIMNWIQEHYPKAMSELLQKETQEGVVPSLFRGKTFLIWWIARAIFDIPSERIVPWYSYEWRGVIRYYWLTGLRFNPATKQWCLNYFHPHFRDSAPASLTVPMGQPEHGLIRGDEIFPVDLTKGVPPPETAYPWTPEGAEGRAAGAASKVFEQPLVDGIANLLAIGLVELYRRDKWPTQFREATEKKGRIPELPPTDFGSLNNVRSKL